MAVLPVPKSMPKARAAIVAGVIWAAFVTAALLLLPIGNATAYGLIVPAAALLLVLLVAGVYRSPSIQWSAWKPDTADLVAIALTYLVVVGLFKVAFAVFGTGQVAGLFLSFAVAMVIDVVVPIIYTVWIRQRPLGSLGFSFKQLPATLALAIVFGVVQFAVTLWGFKLPQPVDWVPLMVMALTVGFFEAVFFRGFVQGTLERSFGAAPAVALAAGLYSLYHFGYGMGPNEMLFLFGLGVVYTVAYRITKSIWAIWPLLVPMGSFYNQIQSGELSGQLPWISILGFVDVLAVMVAAILLAIRHERREHRRAIPAAVAG